jgi:hypothetical protein
MRRPAQAQYSDFAENGSVLSEMKHAENHQIWRTELNAFCA